MKKTEQDDIRMEVKARLNDDYEDTRESDGRI